ncbi:hypothetical protein F511_16302 [Dorcoceras hygrometricum]|uniref:Uncharacterized protein n=1 Tax=Dorcoceras hygrometricum TaxID=472368 RepID=A0A2Z7D1Z9_9LAMI|nr:hypothetical protein F511_16302 [Dorcoceras hygrometricum]
MNIAEMQAFDKHFAHRHRSLSGNEQSCQQISLEEQRLLSTDISRGTKVAVNRYLSRSKGFSRGTKVDVNRYISRNKGCFQQISLEEQMLLSTDITRENNGCCQQKSLEKTTVDVKVTVDRYHSGSCRGRLVQGKNPKIALADKGKEPLVEAGVVKGHPAQEMILDSALPDFSVQISPVVDITSAPTYFVLPSPHQSSSFASSMHFTDDILQGTETAAEQILEPVTATATDINEQFTQFLTSIYEISIKKLCTQSRIGDLQNAIFSKIDTREKDAAEARTKQDQVFRGLFKNPRQGVQANTAALSIEMHEFKKAVRTQNAFFSTDLADLRKEVKDLKAELSKEFYDKLDVIQNDLEFRVETQGQLASLGTNLAELIAFVTKGRDDKKGEVSSSPGRGQPPPRDGGSGGSRSEPSRKRGSSGSSQKSWRYWLNE